MGNDLSIPVILPDISIFPTFSRGIEYLKALGFEPNILIIVT
jgi:hypothetical protein